MNYWMLTCAMLALAPLTAQAESSDIIGGPDGSTQTIHHCGFLPVAAGSYTQSPVTIGIIEHKLHTLGFLPTNGNGTYGKADKKAVRAFQADNGLRVTGEVGPETAQRLAYDTHPSANVHRCYRMAAGQR